VSTAAREMTPSRITELGLLLKLTESLKTHLEQGEWGRAAELEVQRRELVERVFDTVPAATELPVLTATLREVVRINDELIGLAEHRRRAIGRDLDMLAIGRDAARAYQGVGESAGGRRP
jgi:hypothetical protein